jgi:hypothetical protein
MVEKNQHPSTTTNTDNSRYNRNGLELNNNPPSSDGEEDDSYAELYIVGADEDLG